MMDPDVKNKWVYALRSEKYEQGVERLRHGKKFCCLGVLCDLYDPSIWKIDNDTLDYRYMHESESLPSLIVEWAGLSDGNPVINVPCSHDIEMCTCEYGSGDERLGRLNDSGYSFQQIADLIDMNL